MYRLALLAFAAVLALPSSAQGVRTRLNIRLTSMDSSYTVAHLGDFVRYELLAQLSDTQNEGLAMFSVDLDFDGGPLKRAQVPQVPPMNNFVTPLGVGNPEGFGGTKRQSKLLQVGGMQNTINNSFAPQPTGTVITGIAHQEEQLVIGRVEVPSTPGRYQLTASNLVANVIAEGETGVPFWRCEPAVPGANTALTIEAIPVGGLQGQVGAGPGALVPVDVDAGPSHAGHSYWLFGSIVDEGFDGGVQVGGHRLPLRDDAYFRHTFARPNAGVLSGFRGVLDPQGRASGVALDVPAGALRAHVGKRLRHVIAIFDGTELRYLSPPLDTAIVE